jgi:DNA-binding XRE family transcriptional regulator
MTPDELRTARWLLDMTQRALAERLGVSRRIMQHWECGQRPVPPFIALAMSALFSPCGLGAGRCVMCNEMEMTMSDADTLCDDGTPIRDVLADNADLRAEVSRLKGILQTIHNMTTAPHFTAERRWKIRDMTDRRGRNGAA